MDNMLDPFNNPPTGEARAPLQPAAAPRTSPPQASAPMPPRPPQQPSQQQGGMSPQDVQNMIVGILTDYDNQRRAEDEQRHAEQMEQMRSMEAMQRRTEQAEPVRPSPMVVRAPDYRKQFEQEDKGAVPLEVADRPMGPMDKEAVAIVGSIFTIIAAAAPFLGVTLTAAEIDAFNVGITSMISSGVLIAGALGTIIARMRVNSAATVAKAKKEGKL